MLRLQRGGSQADAARELDQGDLRQEIGSLEDFMAERTAVEGEFTPEAQDVNAFFAAEETPPADNRAEAYHEAPAAYGAGDPYAAYAPHEATAAKAAPDGSEAPAAPAVADSADDAVAAVDVAGSEQGSEPAVDEEVDPRDAYEGRWSELKMLAMQRVYARRLGSEMDADYIDEDEFLREMGIDRDSVDFDAFSAEQLEAMMGADNWDPLEELAEYLNGIVERQAAPANGGGPQENVHDPAETAGADVWENMVFASAAEARAYDNGHEPELEAQEPREAPLAEPHAGSGNGRGGSSALADTQSAEEQAAIAATVEAILSRAPEEENEPAVFGPPLEAAGRRRSALLGEAMLLEAAQPPQRAPRLPEAGAARRPQESSMAATTVLMDAPVETAVFLPGAWQRKPIIWRAEYFDNRKLAGEPLLVRQDEEIDFHWRGDSPGEGIMPRSFSVRWSGALSLEPGEYRFEAKAPDGLRLWLNDRLVISAWYDQSEQNYRREFIWHGGRMEVRVEHYENGGDAGAFLTWERVG